MRWKVFYKRRFYGMRTAASQYEAIDMVYNDLLNHLVIVNRRDIVAIPSHRNWNKATAQQELFKNN